MIKIYEKNKWWFGEVTSLNIMTQGHSPEEAIHNICKVLELFLIGCYERGHLDDVLNDQK